MPEACCSTKDFIHICGQDFPTDLVRSWIWRLNSEQQRRTFWNLREFFRFTHIEKTLKNSHLRGEAEKRGEKKGKKQKRRLTGREGFGNIDKLSGEQRARRKRIKKRQKKHLTNQGRFAKLIKLSQVLRKEQEARRKKLKKVLDKRLKMR